ncbi:hypothetical protein V6N11_024608 [Hibiscus sabdariffa]|uniref:Uncharacterized protein n=1 Tax=Hibiscus sabdariffa TaxID=183260 RepID=A0ABR2QMM5_9ROSI
MVDEIGCWDWNRLQQWLPRNVLDKIATVKPPRMGSSADTPGWHWEANPVLHGVPTSPPRVGYYGNKDATQSLVNLNWDLQTQLTHLSHNHRIPHFAHLTRPGGFPDSAFGNSNTLQSSIILSSHNLFICQIGEHVFLGVSGTIDSETSNACTDCRKPKSTEHNVGDIASLTL